MVSGRLLLWVFVVLVLLFAPSLLIHWLTSDVGETSFEETVPPASIQKKPPKKNDVESRSENVGGFGEEISGSEREDERETSKPIDLVPAVKSAGILPPRVSGPLATATPGQAVKTELKIQVFGTLVIDEGDDSRSSALIGLEGGPSRTYFPGQDIGSRGDLKLVRVGQDKIEFLNRGRLEFASLRRASSGGGSPPEREEREEPVNNREEINIPERAEDLPEREIVLPDENNNEPVPDQEEGF